MRYLMEHPQQAAEMGKAAQQRYLDYFTADQMVADYVSLYRSLTTGTNNLHA
jgi:rhamnosyl/mannosyltransferase